MTWDSRQHKAWTIGWYREAAESRLAREARRARGSAWGGRWRFWRRRRAE